MCVRGHTRPACDGRNWAEPLNGTFASHLSQTKPAHVVYNLSTASVCHPEAASALHRAPTSPFRREASSYSVLRDPVARAASSRYSSPAVSRSPNPIGGNCE